MPILIFLFILIIFILTQREEEEQEIKYEKPEKFERTEKAERPERVFGQEGEAKARGIIASVLFDDDILLNNIKVSYEGNATELDNVIINKYGIFIIEVKNYKGFLVGGEDDSEWKKYHHTSAGHIYRKKVRNPLRQVERQIYILANYLRDQGDDIWVKGYALVLKAWNLPNDERILKSKDDIDKAIHNESANAKRLTMQEIYLMARQLRTADKTERQQEGVGLS